NQSARISTIDLKAGRVLWNSQEIVPGGMTVTTVGSNASGDSIMNNIEISSRRVPNTFKTLAGSTGRVLNALTPQTRKEEVKKSVSPIEVETNEDCGCHAESGSSASSVITAAKARKSPVSVLKRNLKPVL
ncbi:MAG: hypothetical protein RJA81_2081, partial [Planctomycetota bacterium]